MKVIRTVSLGVMACLLVIAVLIILLLLNVASMSEIIDSGSRVLAVIGAITLLGVSVQGINRLNH